MQPPIDHNQTAATFGDAMRTIWDGPGRVYDVWHDARKVMRAIGGKYLYPARCDGYTGGAYQLPNDDVVLICNGGGLVRPVKRQQRSLAKARA